MSVDRILITGATGQLGAYLVREILSRGADIVAWSGTRTDLLGVAARPVDLAKPANVIDAFRDASPSIVIHSAAIASVGECVRDPRRAATVNVEGTRLLADLSSRSGCRLLFVSTDLVFDGEAPPYSEEKPPSPLSVYGRTKADAEQAVLESPNHVVTRVSLLFGPSLTDRPSYFDDQIRALRTGDKLRLFHDEWRTPLGLAAASRALVEVALSNVTGLVHVGGPERMSRVEMGRRLAAYLQVSDTCIEPTGRSRMPGEPRPRDTSLDSSRWRGLFPHVPWPTFEESLNAMNITSAVRTSR